MRKFSLVAPLCLFSGLSFAHPSESFLPKNDLHKQDHLFWNNSEINEQKFGEIIDQVSTIYAPIVKAHGGDLFMEKNWDDPTVNAYASQEGDTWKVAMFGGLARRPETTPDGFALVVCHELGHHLAGFAFYGNADWAASEGQSDYFATQACSRMIWGDKKEENAKSAATVHPTAKRKCDAVWQTEDDRNLCYRTAMGGKSLADLLSRLGGTTADFDKPDTSRVSRTNTAHPEGQCRLDTYFNGSLCTAKFDSTVIPGKGHDDGQTSLAAERIASQYSCMTASSFSEGLRPRCWFKPNLTLAFAADQMTVTETNGNNNGSWEPGETVGINVPLFNGLGADLSGATLTISSDNSGIQTAGVANYPTIAADETKAALEAIQVTANDTLQCGARLKLKAVAATSTVKHEEELEFMLGQFKAAGSGGETVNKTIPDNDDQGISVSRAFTGDQKAVRAKITVDIKHSYPADLRITLVSPAGNTYKVWKNKDSIASGINDTFVIDLPNENVAGDWTLNFSDNASSDEGTLKSYNMALEGISCGNAAMTLVGK